MASKVLTIYCLFILLLTVPCPKKLTLERQLKNSIIISWLLPDTIAPQEVHEYRVYVNGQFRTATKWDAKTRALVENIRPLETYRISVRTVTSKGMSEDAACTIMIGKGGLEINRVRKVLLEVFVHYITILLRGNRHRQGVAPTFTYLCSNTPMFRYPYDLKPLV